MVCEVKEEWWERPVTIERKIEVDLKGRRERESKRKSVKLEGKGVRGKGGRKGREEGKSG